MRKVVLLVSLCMLVGLKGFSQFSFGVAPGLSSNSAYFGYKAGKVVPYIGFQVANIRVNTTETGEEFDNTLYKAVSYSEEMKVSGNLYVPNIGIKFFAVEKNNLKAYFNLSVAKPMLRAKVEDNGKEIEEVNDMLKEIKIFGGEFGFGVEYFFDDNFSLGGEFGIRYIGGKYENSYEDSFYDPSVGHDVNTTIEETYKIGLTPTYSKIALNFYFGGSGE